MATRNAHAAFGTGEKLMALAVLALLSVWSGRASEDVQLSELDGLAIQVDRSPCVSFQAEDVAMLTSGTGELLGLVTVRSGAAPGAPLRRSGVTLMRLDIQLLPHSRRVPPLGHTGGQAPPLDPENGIFFARPAPMAPVARARPDPGRRHSGREAHASRQLQGTDHQGDGDAEATGPGGGAIGAAGLLDASSDAGAAAAVSAGVSDVAGRTGNDTHPVANIMVSLSRRVPDACPSRVPALRAAAAVDCSDLGAAGEETQAHAEGGSAGGSRAVVVRRASMLVEVPTSLFRCASDDTEQTSRSFFVQLRVDVSRQKECGADDSEAVYAGEAANEISPGCSYLIVTGECKPDSCPPPPPPPASEQVQLQLLSQQHHQTLQAADPLEPGQQQQAAEARQLLSIAAAVASDTAAAAAVEAEASAGIAAATAVEPHRHRAVSDLAQEVVPADGDAIGVGSVVVEVVGGSGGAGQKGAGAARRKPGEGSAGLLAVVLHGHGPALDEVTPAAAVTTGGAVSRLEAGTEAAGATKGAAAPRELRARLGVSNPTGAAALLASKLQAGGSSSSRTIGDGGMPPSIVGPSGHGGDKAWADPAADARRLQQHAPGCIGAECPPATRRRWLLYAVGGVIGSTALAAGIAAFLMRSRTRAAAAVAAAAAAAAEALASMAAADAVAKMAAAAAPASVEAAMVDPVAAPLPALQISAAVMEMDGKAASPRPTSPTTFDRSGSIAGASPAIVGSCTAASGDLYRPSWDGRMSSSGSGAVGYAQLVLGRSGSYSSTTACAGALPPLPYDRSGSSNSVTAAAFPAPYDRSGSSNSTTAAAAAATPYNRTGSSTSTHGVGAMPIVVISRGGGGDTVTATSSPTPASYVPHSMHASFSSSTADIYSPRRSRWLPPQGTAAAAAAGAVAGAGAVAPRGSPSHFMSQSFTHGHAAPPQHIAAAGVLNTRSQLPPSSPAYAPGTDTYAHTPSGSARVRQQQYVGGGGGDAVAGAAGVSDSGAAAPSPRSNVAVGIGIDAGGGSAAATGPPLRTSSTGRLATIFSRSDESLPVLPAELVAAMRHQFYERQDVYEHQQQQQEQQAQQQGLVAPLGLQPLGKLRYGSEPHSGSTGPGQEPPAAPRQASSSAAVSPFWAVGGAGSGITPRMETRRRNGSGSAPVEPYVLADEHRQQHHDVLGSAASTCSRYSVSAVQSRQHTEPGGATSEPGSAPEAAPAPGSAVSWVAGENLKQPRKLPAAAPLSPNFQQYGAPGAGAGSRTHLTATASATASPLRPPGSFARGSMHTTRPSVPASPAQQPQAHRPPESLLAQLQPLGSPVTPPSVATRDAKQRLLHQQQRQVEPGAKRVGGALLGVFDGAAVTKITGQDAAHAPTHGAAPHSKVIVENQLHASKLDCEEVDSKAAFAAAATAAATTAALGIRGALSPLHRHEVLDEALLPASGPATAQHENLHLGNDDEDDGAGMGGDCMGEDGDEGFVSAALYAGQPLSATGSQSGGVPGLTLRASSISTNLAAAAAVAAALQQQSQSLVDWPGPGRAAGATEEGAASSASVAMGQARWSQSTVPGGAPLASQGSISIGGGVAISLQPTMQQDRHGRMAERQLQPQRPQHSSAHGEYGLPHGAATHGKSFHRLMGGGVVGSSPTTLDGGVHPQRPGTRLASFTHTTGGAAAAAVAASRMGVVTTTAVATTASASSTPPVYTRTSAAGSGPGAGGWRGWGGVGSGTPPLQPRSGAQSAAATAPTSPFTLIGVTAAHVPGVTCTLPAPSSDGSPARDVC